MTHETGTGGDEFGAEFSALLEDSAEDLYDNAPCGYLSTLLDGTITKINATLLGWLGYRRDEVVGQRRFAELLTVGGRIYHETHFAPLLRMQGELSGVALELKAADGTRLPVLVTSAVKTGDDGQAQLIRTTVFDARDRRAYENELLRARQEAEQARADAERARDQAQQLARTLQQTLVPPVLSTVPGVDVAAYYHPASNSEVGGDFYDLFPLTGGTWGFFLGDVSGKGAAAATVTSLTRYTLRAAAVHDPDPAAVLHTLNTVLLQEHHDGLPRLCTVVHGLLEPDGDGCAITLASGGHPPAVHLHHDGTCTTLDTPGGHLVGALPHARFTTTHVRLAPGDTVLLYTDGLVEARPDPASRARYSERELHEFLAAMAPVTAPGVITALTRLLADFGDGVDDDTALLALGIPGQGAQGT